MCGIAALLRTDDHRADLSELRRMCSFIRHRGPDGSGHAQLHDGRLLFGHVRLSVIDMDTGDQPLFNEDGSICLIVNGELYDHAAIRERLQAQGHRFQTRTDSEIILHLYEEHGLDLFAHLNGEFAFVLWDAGRKRLLAAKDRFGIKPLFYARHQGRFALSSEGKAILSLPGFPRQISSAFLGGPSLGSMDNSSSAFEGIHCLRPGHYLLVDPRASPREVPYWKPTFDTDETVGFAEACDGVRSRLQRAVRRRMIADVPVVAHLSGGLDSTLVCREMTWAGKPPQFFTVGFGDSVLDESSIACDSASHLGVATEVIPCTPERLAGEVERCVWHIEAPISNPSSVAKQLLSARVRERGYKVCLTGAGADEIFGGYAYFKLEALWRKMLQGGSEERDALALWERFKQLEHRNEGATWRRRLEWRKGPHRFGYPSFFELNVAAGERVLPHLYSRAIRERLDGGPLSQVAREFDVAWMRTQHPFNATRVLSLSFMSNFLIPKVGDRVEMAYSVECRTPFLDTELVDYVLRLPPRHFMDLALLREKHVLKEAYTDVLPPLVKRAHKHPFIAPGWGTLAATPRGRELIEDHLSRRSVESAGIFNPWAVQGILMAWRLVPRRLALAKRLDSVLGAVLTQQILSRALAEKPLEARQRIEMRDLSWKGQGASTR